MKKITIALISLILIGGMVFTASAFTSSELSRDANIQVTDDTDGIISLNPGDTDAVTLVNGALTIDTAHSGAGLNIESVFTYGNPTDVTNDHAFNVTNTDSQARELTFSYENVVDNEGQTEAVQFIVYDSTGAQIATADAGSSATFSAATGDTYYVVMEVDTSSLSPSADLSGDFVIRT